MKRQGYGAVEIAEAIKDTNMYELACKTNAELDLTDSEKVTVSQLDAYFKKVGERGTDPEHEIAAFVKKAINEEIYNAPDELLDYLFNRDNIGEFDDFEGVTDPKNTLVAYETAKGANVKRSFLDIGVLKPAWFNLQIESDISYKDLRKNGWKSVAVLTENAVAAFKAMNLFGSNAKKPAKVLFLIKEYDEMVDCATYNIGNLWTMEAASANTYSVLYADTILFTKDALDEFVKKLA